MEFWLQKENDAKFQLPVKPSDYDVTVSHKNTVVNVIRLGDLNLLGNTGLREIPISSFFPAQDYNFSNNSERHEPQWYVKKIEGWRKANDVIRVIITDTLNMACTVESFNWGERDATGDIYYTLSLKEHKIPSTTSGGSVRTVRPVQKASAGKEYTVKEGDCLWAIAKQFYGDGGEYMKIYNANSGKIQDPNLIYVGQVLQIP